MDSFYNNTTCLILMTVVLVFLSSAVQAQESSGQFGGGSVIIGYDNQTCVAGLSGAMRYNSSAGIEFCNGSAWLNTVNGGGGVCSSGSDGSGATIPTLVAYDEGFEEGTISSFTATLPAGVQEDDLILLMVQTMENNSLTDTPDNPPAGYIPIGHSTHISGTCNTCAYGHAYMYYKIASASETNPSITLTGALASHVQAYASWATFAFRGVDTLKPIHAITFWNEDNGARNAPNAPAITTTIDNTKILRVWAVKDDTMQSDAGYAAGHTGVFSVNAPGDDGSHAAATIDAATATTVVAAGHTLNGGAFDRSVNFSIAICPE